jgi:heat shock protein HtpX
MQSLWNNSRTVLLLGGLTGLFLLIGGGLGGQTGLFIAFIFAALLNLGAWWFSDTIALKFSGAQEASPQQAPELHRMVEQLAQRAGLPKPRVYMIQSPMPNAFATGRSPEKGAVAVTTGIMGILNKHELEGVIAHELAHIKHRDTLISSIAATIAGAISMLADMAMWSMIFGGFNNDEEGAGGIVGGFLTIFLAPIAALLIQMAISRSREYVADAGGAQIAGTPNGLASALQKLEDYSKGVMQPQHINPATAHMYIVNPLHGGGMLSLFSTHPPTQERIARLRALTIERSSVTA